MTSERVVNARFGTPAFAQGGFKKANATGRGRCASRTSFTLQTGNILYTLLVVSTSVHSNCLFFPGTVAP
jgi:hypothetical protein